jgi:hypothetical protein
MRVSRICIIPGPLTQFCQEKFEASQEADIEPPLTAPDVAFLIIRI